MVGGDPLQRSNLTVRAHAFTASAQAAIEENGGKCVVMSRSRPVPLVQALYERKLLKTEQNKRLRARRALIKERDLAKAQRLLEHQEKEEQGDDDEYDEYDDEEEDEG